MTPFEEQLRNALKETGYLLPESLEELEQFEKYALDRKLSPPMPEELKDPSYILSKGYSNPCPISDNHTNEEVPDFLAIAARSGNSIPDHIREKMRCDRENAREKE